MAAMRGPHFTTSRLQAQGLTVTSDQQSVADLVGGDLRKQIGTISKVLPAAKP